MTLAGVQIEADGLAMSPAGGLFAFQVNAGGGSRLLTLNPTTAVATVLGPVLPGRNIRGAAFTLSGRLLAFDYTPRELVEVSPVTGQQVGAGETDRRGGAFIKEETAGLGGEGSGCGQEAKGESDVAFHSSGKFRFGRGG